MSDTEQHRDGRKRVVTTDGEPLGWASRGADDALYVVPQPGLLRSCDSWIAPSWHERGEFRLDAAAVVGVGEATVVVDVADFGGSGSDAVDPASDATGRRESEPPR